MKAINSNSIIPRVLLLVLSMLQSLYAVDLKTHDKTFGKEEQSNQNYLRQKLQGKIDSIAQARPHLFDLSENATIHIIIIAVVVVIVIVATILILCYCCKDEAPEEKKEEEKMEEEKKEDMNMDDKKPDADAGGA